MVFALVRARPGPCAGQGQDEEEEKKEGDSCVGCALAVHHHLAPLYHSEPTFPPFRTDAQIQADPEDKLPWADWQEGAQEVKAEDFRTTPPTPGTG